MQILLIATVFGLFAAHHKGRIRGKGHDDDNDDDDGEDDQEEGQ